MSIDVERSSFHNHVLEWFVRQLVISIPLSLVYMSAGRDPKGFGYMRQRVRVLDGDISSLDGPGQETVTVKLHTFSTNAHG